MYYCGDKSHTQFYEATEYLFHFDRAVVHNSVVTEITEIILLISVVIKQHYYMWISNGPHGITPYLMEFFTILTFVMTSNSHTWVVIK
jgi:hypothetical protein